MSRTSESIRNERPAGAAAPAAAAAYGLVLDAAGGEQVASICSALDRHSLAVALYRSPPYDLQIPAMEVSRLSVNLTASRVTGGVESERGRMFNASRHSMFFTPAGATMRWRKASPSRHLNIYFRPSLQADEAGLTEHLLDFGPIFNVSLPGSGALVEQLAAEVVAPGPFAGEAVDCLARMLLVMLARRRGRAPNAGAMSAALLRRLEDHVDANLGARIHVSDLAAVAGLPPEVFAKAYLRYTGRTPYQFVLALRVERAAELLRHGSASLAEVASICGFSNQQHMTRVLTERLGMAPATLRRAALHKTGGT